MLTKEQNERLTRTDRGTPGGTLLRSFWQPAALSEELPPKSGPKAIRLLGEDLVLFRDANGKPGLLGLHCPHRGCDLSYGRPEDGGLRCLYHGWLFATDGRCLEQPGEPPGSTFKARLTHLAYPCYEANGLILTYMGAGDAPPVPRLPFLSAPSENVWCTKLWHDCNYLQGNEGNIDPNHLSFLHRPTRDNTRKDYDAIARDVAPRLEIEETPFGLRIYAVRTMDEDHFYIRVTYFMMPNLSFFEGNPPVDPQKRAPLENESMQCNWHVPVDDTHHYKYVTGYRYDGPIDSEYLNRDVVGQVDAKYARRASRDNRYGQDRDTMDRNFTGMGDNFYDHDRFAVESLGPILDRTVEHLGATDVAVAAMRRQMLEAIEARGATGDLSADALAGLVVRAQRVPKTANIHDFWREPISRG